MLAVIFLTLTPGGLCQESEKWKEYHTPHVIIYYKDVPEDFIKSIEETAEYYYQEITANLGFTRYENWSWDSRAKIYLYRDDREYLKAYKQASWSHGMAAVREKVIRTFPSAHGFFDSTLPHELGHIIFREFVGFKADIPIWLEEGVAMYQEKARRWGANKTVKEAIENKKFMSLGELSKLELYGTDAKTADLFYAESASVVYYLMTELGKYKFLTLCAQLKSGDSFERALLTTYIRFKNIDDLNRSWMDYLERGN